MWQTLHPYRGFIQVRWKANLKTPNQAPSTYGLEPNPMEHMYKTPEQAPSTYGLELNLMEQPNQKQLLMEQPKRKAAERSQKQAGLPQKPCKHNKKKAAARMCSRPVRFKTIIKRSGQRDL